MAEDEDIEAGGLVGEYCDSECREEISERVAEKVEGGSSGSCSCTSLPFVCGQCSVRGIPQILYLMVAFFITLVVLIMLFVDMIITRLFSTRDMVFTLVTILAFWTQSPVQPFLDTHKNKKNK